MMDNLENDVQYFTQKSGLKTAYRYTPSRDKDQPIIVFLPGYMSDMDGGKACALYDDARQNGQGCLLLDYSGCGRSGGDFADGALSLWRDEVLALIEALNIGRIILIGSSMGGWLMLMIALKRGASVHAMIGIAAAPDFTAWGYGDDERATIDKVGVLYEDNDYGYDPTPMHKKFYDDGQANLLLGHEIAIDCPTILFHGQNDNDVPYDISMQLAHHLRSSHVHINLIKDADHRFSSAQDIAMLINATKNLL